MKSETAGNKKSAPAKKSAALGKSRIVKTTSSGAAVQSEKEKPLKKTFQPVKAETKNKKSVSVKENVKKEKTKDVKSSAGSPSKKPVVKAAEKKPSKNTEPVKKTETKKTAAVKPAAKTPGKALPKKPVTPVKKAEIKKTESVKKSSGKTQTKKPSVAVKPQKNIPSKKTAAPVKNTEVKKAPAVKTTVKPSPKKAETPAKKTESKKVPAVKTTAKPSPKKAETPVKKAETKKAPAVKTTVKTAPKKAETPAKKTESKKASAVKTTAKPSPKKVETPVKKTEVKKAPAVKTTVKPSPEKPVKKAAEAKKKVSGKTPEPESEIPQQVQNATSAEEAAVQDRKNGKAVLKLAAVAKNDTMKVYMHDIGQISLVTKDQEKELADKIHGEDIRAHDEARTTLIRANLRLVVKIAHDFKGLGLPLLDLISEGNIGLMRAVEKFDPAKGAKFSSYAAWWIKQSMRRALANQSRTIRIPVQSAGKINKIKSVRMKLTEKFGREPTDAEIAEHLDYSERTVAGLRLADLRTFSLQDPIQQGEDGEFQDIIPDRSTMTPDRILSDVESVGRLISLLSELDIRERMILQMRFGLDGKRPKTLEEVSQEIGRTRERVRQIQNQALTKLRALLADESGFAND